MPIKNPTPWSNADTKNPTIATNADPKSKTAWANSDTKNPTEVTPDEKNDTDWQPGANIVTGNLILFATDLRTLMSNDGRMLMSSASIATGKSPTIWTPTG